MINSLKILKSLMDENPEEAKKVLGGMIKAFTVLDGEDRAIYQFVVQVGLKKTNVLATPQQSLQGIGINGTGSIDDVFLAFTDVCRKSLQANAKPELAVSGIILPGGKIQ